MREREVRKGEGIVNKDSVVLSLDDQVHDGAVNRMRDYKRDKDHK